MIAFWNLTLSVDTNQRSFVFIVVIILRCPLIANTKFEINGVFCTLFWIDKPEISSTRSFFNRTYMKAREFTTLLTFVTSPKHSSMKNCCSSLRAFSPKSERTIKLVVSNRSFSTIESWSFRIWESAEARACFPASLSSPNKRKVFASPL